MKMNTSVWCIIKLTYLQERVFLHYNPKYSVFIEKLAFGAFLVCVVLRKTGIGAFLTYAILAKTNIGALLTSMILRKTNI